MSPIALKHTINYLTFPTFPVLQVLVCIADVVDRLLGRVRAGLFIVRVGIFDLVALEIWREGVYVVIVQPLEDEVEESLAGEFVE